MALSLSEMFSKSAETLRLLSWKHAGINLKKQTNKAINNAFNISPTNEVHCIEVVFHGSFKFPGGSNRLSGGKMCERLDVIFIC